MKPKSLLLRIYGERTDGQWSLICLDLSLAAQAATLPEAKKLLEEQIKQYVYDAVIGQDKQYASTLLTRKAPLKYWMKWWVGHLINVLGVKLADENAFCAPMPLVPA